MNGKKAAERQAESAKSVVESRVYRHRRGTPVREASVADITTARPTDRPGLAGRERVRADSVSGTAYRTFPARLPVILSVLGGGLVALGSLGASVRASAIERTNTDPTTVRSLFGYKQGANWMLLILGLALAVVAFAWLSRSTMLRLALVGVSAAVIALTALRLASFNSIAADWATEARKAPDFIGFHAGLGWGAWTMLAGAILAGFGLLVGALRALDLRRGLAG